MSNLIHKLNENFPSTNFVGGIFPRGHVSIIAAKAGVGKTWYILKLLADLSKGGTIFNNQAYYEPKRNCLLFVGETGMGLLAERQRQMHDKADYDRVFMVSRVDAIKKNEDIAIDDVEGKKRILDVCNKTQPDIIVFDTMMSFQNGDESDVKDMSRVMNTLMHIAEDRRCAVIVTHHLRKGSKEDKEQRITQDEIIGSSALVRLCGNAFVLQKIGFQTYTLNAVKTWWEMPPKITYEMVKENNEIFFNPVEIEVNYTDRRMEAEKYLKSLNPQQLFEITERTLIEKFSISKNQAAYSLRKFRG